MIEFDNKPPKRRGRIVFFDLVDDFVFEMLDILRSDILDKIGVAERQRSCGSFCLWN